jgi:hypothetical protein
MKANAEAERLFRKDGLETEGREAAPDYERRARTEREKMTRLKALRLRRDAGRT